MPDTGTGTAVYAANETAGTEVSSTYEGRHLTFLLSELATVVSGTVVKGEPVCVRDGRGDIVGVAFTSSTTAADRIAIDTEGIWNLLVYADDDLGEVAVAVGDALYIDTDDGGCTISRRHDPEQHTLFGYALGAVNSGEEAIIAVKVHWGPSEDRILMGIDANGGTRYTEAVTGMPRVQINSDYSGASGIHINQYPSAALAAASTAASLYTIRAIADVSAATTMTDGNLHGVHGYARVYGTLDGGGLGGVRIAGVKGEVYSDAAVITACDFISGVMAFATLDVRPTAGVYAAYIAYSASGVIYPDAMFYGYGRFMNGIDLTGWNATNAGDNHTIVLDNSFGYDASVAAVGGGATIACIRVEIGGVDGWVPVLAAAL